MSYDARRTSLARKMFDRGTLEERGILVGAGLSLTAYEKMFNHLPKVSAVQVFCPFCKERTVPNWMHLAWRCHHFDDSRGQLQEPACPMSSRLGWPADAEEHETSAQRLSFLAQIRAEVRDQAWRSTGGRRAFARRG